MIPNLILTILQELEIDCLTEKARALSKGKGLVEPWLPDEPEDALIKVCSLPIQVKPSLDEILPLPVQKAKPPSDEMLAFESPKEKALKSLAEIIASSNVQINIDETIQSATCAERTEVVADVKGIAVPAQQNVQLQNISVSQSPPHNATITPDEALPKYTLSNRLSARHEAKVQWRYDRYKLEYEYARTKQQTNDYCDGLDFVLNALKQMQRKCDALTVTIVEGER